jgi:hypothetical protein
METADGENIILRLLTDNPLVRYSVYTHVQYLCLQKLMLDFCATLDVAIQREPSLQGEVIVDVAGYNRSYGQAWLWVLGAYEVVRTMCQTPSCFSPPLAERLRALKKRLTLVRIPFAKQELAGTKESVSVEPSPSGIRSDPCDLVFDIGGRAVSIRRLMNDWDAVFTSITLADVVGDRRDHREARPSVRVVEEGVTMSAVRHFKTEQKVAQSGWRKSTAFLSELARTAQGYYSKTGGGPYDFCLPIDCAEENLFEAIRPQALDYFRAPPGPLGGRSSVVWHDGRGKPSTHLCDSQVCCVNFLFALRDSVACVPFQFRMESRVSSSSSGWAIRRQA